MKVLKTLIDICAVRYPLQSHPIGKMADFVSCTFNIYGQSPLVAHFLQMKNLQVDAGSCARIKRTELHNLPPYPSHYIENANSLFCHFSSYINYYRIISD